MTSPITLTPGTRLGRYEIDSLIGAGAMGQVYMAHDTELGRAVAIKLLRDDLVTSREHLRRFEQEARAASTLNYPNILTIYEIGRVGSNHFIAAEFVDGQTLRKLVGAGPMGVHKALDLAKQIAAGLAVAHAARIVHRDIKPENIMLRRDGYVKVLDFGLAKLTEGLLTSQHNEGESTISNLNTESGTVVGTISYMSPEQLRGMTVDARTDIWSLGVVLYEMLTGRLPFSGDSAADTIVSILRQEPPPVERFAPTCPPDLRRIVAKMLVKDRDRRYQTMDDFLSDVVATQSNPGGVSQLSAGGAQPSDVGAEQRHSSGQKSSEAFEKLRRETSSGVQLLTQSFNMSPPRLLLSAAFVVALCASVYGLYGSAQAALLSGGAVCLTLFAYAYARGKPTVAPEVFQSVRLSCLTQTGKAVDAVLSPDGKYVVHVNESNGQQSLWIRQIATSSNVQIVPPADVTYRGTTFSPDGNYVYYLLFENSNKNEWLLFRVPALGGLPQKLANEVSTPVTFSPDGRQIAFVRCFPSRKETSIFITDAEGKSGRMLATRSSPDDFGWRSGTSWSPDGKRIACAVGTYDLSMSIVEVSVEDGTERPLTTWKWPWIGRLAWQADGKGLIANARDASSGLSQLWHVSHPDGKVRRITNDLSDYSALSVSLSVSSDSLVSVQCNYLSGIWVWPTEDLNRGRQITSGRSDGFYGLAWTPDNRITYVSTASGHPAIWIMDADGGHQTQLTTDLSNVYHPSVSPDGRHIVFISTRGGVPNIWRIDVTGDNLMQLTDQSVPSWPHCLPDGRWVIYKSIGFGKKTLWKVPIEGGVPEQVTDKHTGMPAASPDGRFVACEYWDEQPTSQFKLAVIPLDGQGDFKTFDVPPTFAQSVHLMSVLRWTPDGSGLTYIDNQRGVSNIWCQPIDGSPPRQLTDFQSERIFWFDWSPDGKHLACARGVTTSDVVLIRDSARETT
jgi:serine/threonine protein kinase